MKRRNVFPFHLALKHAVSEGIKAPGRDASVKVYLTSLLDVLENVRSVEIWRIYHVV